MNNFVRNKALWLSVALAMCINLTAAVFGQTVSQPPVNQKPKPLVQPITVQTRSVAKPQLSSVPLVTKTGSSVPVIPRKTSFPVLADVEIPGFSGILVEDLSGNVVMDSFSNYAFNPASNVKIATAYAVLKTFGPDYRFPTNVWTDGQIDTVSGTLYGNLYVSGRDPIFSYEHAVTIANELNRLGIRSIAGDLIVTDNFVMNFNTSAQRAGSTFSMVLDSSKRPVAATRAWQSYLVNSGKYSQVTGVPGVSISGGVYVQAIPTNAILLFSHESTPMREIVKTTLCYSNNFLSERLGDMLGGSYAVARIVQQNTQIQPQEFILQSSSGLGINRVTPTAMMKLLRVLRKELARNKMTFADIMPVAGIDKGTLENRFDTDFSRGSVVGKTGTLPVGDGGVSSLAGEIQTKSGKLLFVIFNQRGNVNRFRSFQNSLVSLIQGQLGGAASLEYMPVTLDTRLAKTRITYPDSRSKIGQ
ncbi:MAG TPA: D-alanyl-D-alanine carboxypeptidase [Pyrinomonadaceae bacterium]|nr:D-alanyl-D-alanine carboxypeptidase [Pyrinomonadaceae bacterium]